MAFNLKDFENKLWDTADALRANTGLKYNEFSTPVATMGAKAWT